MRKYLPVLCLLWTGCVTPAEERQLRDDIFSLQNRLVQMESALNSQGKEISTASVRQEASLATRLDKIAIEIQRIKGDIDSLKVGITTGQLPGGEGSGETSIGKTVQDLSARIDAMEENQTRIIAAIDKAIETKKPEKKGASKEKDDEERVRGFKDLKSAFEDKNYKLIADQGEGNLNKLLDGIKTKKTKQEATYMIAESLYKSSKVRDAALRFNDYLDSKPSEHVAFSLLRMGDCFRQLGDNETAKIYYQELIQKHAKSKEAEQARDKLAKI